MSFQNSITLVPIARVEGERKEPIDDQWDSVQSTIALDPAQFKADALAGLDAFSHIEVCFTSTGFPMRRSAAALGARAGEKIGRKSASLRNAAKAVPTGSACASAGSNGSTGSRCMSAASTRSTERPSSTSSPS